MILIIQHAEPEGPGIIGDFFDATDWHTETVRLYKPHNPCPTQEIKEGIPKDLSGVEAIILMGGPINVYEEKRYPFLNYEDLFLKKALQKEVPILGICLGAQLLAKACGARVKKAHKKEIGWYNIFLTDVGRKDPLFKGMDDEMDVFQWHEDTFGIPQHADLIATSASCKNQAFRWTKSAYGLQFHFEVTPKMVELWCKDSDVGSKTMVIEAYNKKTDFEKQALRILLNFSRFIK
jgi:GMP synthase (glutamine-hydrolysing)